MRENYKYNIERSKPWKPKTFIKTDELVKFFNSKIKQEPIAEKRLVLSALLEEILKPLGSFWGYHVIDGDDSMREYY